MWIAPPSGLRFISAATTTSVSFAVSSRTRADAAPCPPLTARKALVTAIAIFEGSNATTAPLRRITLYWASRGSLFAAGVALASPGIRLRCAVEDGVAAELATCIECSPVRSYVLGLPALRLALVGHVRRSAAFRLPIRRRRPSPPAPGPKASRNPLRIKTTISCVQVLNQHQS